MLMLTYQKYMYILIDYEAIDIGISDRYIGAYSYWT